MSGAGFAKLPPPPYYAVIFSSRRTPTGEEEYAATAEHLFEIVQTQPGFLGAESTRGADGFGITVAYFDSEESIANWRRHSEHAAARERGKREWYEHVELRIAKVERAYSSPTAHENPK